MRYANGEQVGYPPPWPGENAGYPEPKPAKPPQGKAKRVAMTTLGFLIYWVACVAFIVGAGLLSLSWVFMLTGFGGVVWVFNAISQDRLMSIFIAPIVVFAISAAVTIRHRRRERRWPSTGKNSTTTDS